MIDAFTPKSPPLTRIDEHSTTQNTLFELSDFPLLDVEVGLKTTGTTELLADMLRFLLNESLPQDLILLNEAYVAQDWDKVQHLAHKIKGGAVYVGTVKMSIACQYFERYQKSGETLLLDSLYQQTRMVINDTIAHVSHWLESYSSN